MDTVTDVDFTGIRLNVFIKPLQLFPRRIGIDNDELVSVKPANQCRFRKHIPDVLSDITQYQITETVIVQGIDHGEVVNTQKHDAYRMAVVQFLHPVHVFLMGIQTGYQIDLATVFDFARDSNDSFGPSGTGIFLDPNDFMNPDQLTVFQANLIFLIQSVFTSRD